MTIDTGPRPPAGIAALVERLRQNRLQPRSTKPLEIIEIEPDHDAQVRWAAKNNAWLFDGPPSPAPERQRRALAFTKRDLRRAMDACEGRNVRSVEIDPTTGRIVIIPEKPEPSIMPVNEWDSVQ